MWAMCPMVMHLEDRDREIAGDVELALSRAGLDVTQAAYTMGLDPAQWSKQRQGIGHISLYRLARLGPEFWREFAAARLRRVNCRVFEESELTAALLQVISLARKPMAAMARERKERSA